MGEFPSGGARPGGTGASRGEVQGWLESLDRLDAETGVAGNPGTERTG